MKTPTLRALLFVCMLVPNLGLTQDSTPHPDQARIDELAEQKVLYDQMKETLTAEKEVATLESELRAKKAEEWTEILEVLATNAGEAPTGAITVADGFVPTPETTGMTMKFAEDFSAELVKAIKASLTDPQPPLIFNSTLPSLSTKLELELWLLSAEAALKGPRAGNKAGFSSGSGLALASALVALPSAIQGITQLFSTDLDVKSGPSGITADILEALVISGLQKPKPPPANAPATPPAPATNIFNSADSYAWAVRKPKTDSSVLKKLDSISDELTKSSTGLAQAQSEKAAAEKKLKDYTEKKNRAQTNLAAAQLKLSATLKEQMLADEKTAPKYAPLIDAYQNEVATAQAALDDVTGAPDGWQQQIDDATTKVNAFSAAIQHYESFISSSLGTPEKVLPRIIQLIKWEILDNAFEPASAVRFVTLGIAADSQSSVDRKSVIRRRYYSAAYLAVEYTVQTPAGQIVANGIVTKGVRKKIDLSEEEEDL